MKKNAKHTFIGMIWVVVITCSWGVAYASERIAATYSSIRLYEETGDIGGEEITIVPARDGWQGTYMIAEGNYGELELIRRIKITKTGHVTFNTLKGAYYVEFEGELSASGLKGTFQSFELRHGIFSDKKIHLGTRKVTLPRKKCE